MPSTINTEETLVTAFCKAWNNLDISYIQNYLSEDFDYTSQMVLEPIYGKNQYLNYLTRKFVAIKEGNDPVTAEIGYFDNSPCLIISQQLATAEKALFKKLIKMDDGITDTFSVITNIREAIILFKFNGEKVKSASLCTVAPGINDIKRTGTFPK